MIQSSMKNGIILYPRIQYMVVYYNDLLSNLTTHVTFLNKAITGDQEACDESALQEHMPVGDVGKKPMIKGIFKFFKVQSIVKGSTSR